MDNAPLTISRLVDLVDDFEEALAKAPEPEDGTRAFPNTLELIDRLVRVIQECEHVTDEYRASLAQFEDDMNTGHHP